ncbi:ABC transporter substrate-binding protein [Lachnobacterium bovis]|uniref:NitT/TauT family transport system substrate-binding protein n=1 Tax=Lachnobacterium bovis DSM 14045 TaxID=1122142 RepID=A0A1H3JAR6_9FIRM|nr:ABC transporter substrate-binding protein [Lachnobacterium bovis]SDY37022.1 NitT/TauT family transport system substrate-binding protein [Lachnobacterium bovis DSM 14045]
MKGKRKKYIVGLLLLTMTVSLFSGCSKFGKKKSSKDLTVKILNNKESLCLAPVHIAIINGYFDEEFKAAGEKYKIVNSNIDTVTEQITSGEINAGYGLTGTLMQPISNGLPISFVTGLHRGCTKFYSKKGSSVKSLEDLKGKTIGVPSLSDSSLIQMKRKLFSLGFKVNGSKPDVTFVAYAMNDLPTALDKQAVDAVGLHDPVAYNAEKKYDFIKILDIGEDKEFSNEYCCQAYVSQELIKNNPKGAAAYTRAIQRAAAFVQANPEEAARLQVKHGYMPSEREEDVVNYGKILASLNYEPSVKLGRKTFEATFKDLQKTKDIDSKLDLKKFTEKVYPDLKWVPEGYTYDNKTKKFKEIKK